MDLAYEQIYHQLEQTHFWFRARRDYILRRMQQWHIAKNAAILEVGCSGGPLLQALADQGYANVQGIDLSPAGIGLCHQRNLKNASIMDATALAFADQQFDLVIASDILEHIDQEAKALSEWRRVLKPGGKLLVMVPAYTFLWSQHDEVNHHFRRYTRGRLAAAMRQAGFSLTDCGYWNATLFPPVALVRVLRKCLPHPKRRGDARPTASLINSLFYCAIKIENSLALRGIRAPFGLSVLAVGE